MMKYKKFTLIVISFLFFRTTPQVLATNGSETNLSNEKKRAAPVHLAAQNGELEVVAFLLNNGAQLDSRDYNGDTPLHFAAQQGHPHVVAFLLNNGAQLESKNKDGKTPLHLAAWHGHPHVVEVLLNNGAQLESQDIDGCTPLHLAACYGHPHVVEVLLNNGAQLESQDNGEDTPLHLAACYGHPHVVAFLLNNGAQLESRDDNGDTPLHIAAQQGHPHVVAFLLNNGAQLESKNKDGKTPLHLAAWHGHPHVVEVLLNNGAQLESQDIIRCTPLHYAAAYGHPHVVEVLLNNGAQLESQDNDGDTPLHLAVVGITIWSLKLDVVNLLLNSGANPNPQTRSERFTPLHFAAREGDLDLINLLLKEKASPHFSNNEGSTPLHLAAKWGFCEIVSALLNQGAYVDAKDRDLSTPLHLAAQKGHLEVARLLLKSGAKFSNNDNTRQTPLSLANSSLGYQPNPAKQSIVNLLELIAALHEKNASKVVNYLQSGKTLDFDVLRESLKPFDYQEAQWKTFSDSLILLKDPDENLMNGTRVEIIVNNQNQKLNLKEAKEKLIEFLKECIQNSQELQALQFYKNGDGTSLKAHLLQNKAVNINLLEDYRGDPKNDYQRFFVLCNTLNEGHYPDNKKFEQLIDFVKSKNTLHQMLNQTLRDETIKEIQTMSNNDFISFCSVLKAFREQPASTERPE